MRALSAALFSIALTGAAVAAPDAPAAAPATQVIVPASPAPAAPAPAPSASSVVMPPAAAMVGADTQEVQLVHVVEKRPFTEAGRWETSLFAPVQVNAKFTLHAGLSAEVAYHIRENLAAQVGFTWFPLAVQSSFTEELVTKVRQQPLAANALLLQGGAMAGLELMPVYGKINLFDGKILRFGFYLNAGLGAGKTRLQLRPSDNPKGRSFGDTGVRPMAGLGVGFRVFVNEKLTVRLELRDLVYSAFVSKVNGCDASDTKALGLNEAAPVKDGCSASAFGDTAADIKTNASIAADQIKESSADVVNNVAAYAGLSYLF
jgi:outer membrane beta-barrel protein